MTEVGPPAGDGSQADWRTPDERARDIAQAMALREQAVKGGLRFAAGGYANWYRMHDEARRLLK